MQKRTIFVGLILSASAATAQVQTPTQPNQPQVQQPRQSQQSQVLTPNPGSGSKPVSPVQDNLERERELKNKTKGVPAVQIPPPPAMVTDPATPATPSPIAPKR